MSLLCLLLADTVSADDAAKARILFIGSYHPAFPTFSHQIEGLRSVLKTNVVDLDIEFMDSKRYSGPENERLFFDLLKYKLKHSDQYDLIITGDDNALLFALKYQHTLFQGMPVVFFGVNNVKLARLQNDNAWVTGVVENVSMQDTLKLITDLQPGVRRITAIADGTASSMADSAQYHEIRTSENSSLMDEFSLAKHSFVSMAAYLKNLNPKTDAVLLLSAYRDVNGKVLTFNQSLDLITENLRAPLYHLWYHGLNRGVLGGKVVSHYHQARAAADIALKILSGASVRDIPVGEKSPNQYIFDYKQLRRFSIPLERLPKGSIVYNQPSSLYQRYRNVILSLSGTVFFLILIIIILIISNRHIRQARIRLSESEAFLTAIIDNIPAGLIVKDADTHNVVRVNRAYEKFTGLSNEEIIGKPDIFSEADTDMAKIHDEERRIIENGAVVQLRQEITDRATLQTRTADVKKFMFRAENGMLKYILIICEDITERIESEKKQQTLEDKLRQSQKMEALGNLAGGIAHDFNNILTAILGYSEMVSQSVEAESKISKNISRVLQAGERAKELVQQILSFSRRSSPVSRPVSPASVIEETLNLMRAGISSSIRIETEIDDALPKIQGDPTQLHQLFLNLCTNASHAMNEHGGVLKVTAHTIYLSQKDDPVVLGHLKPGEHIIISVSDTGKGIEKDILHRIFEPYFTTKKGEGSGFGLAVVHGIIKSHKGYITVYSEAGRGSSFTMYFPVLQGDDHTDDGDERADAEPPTGTETVLAVDDEEVIVELETSILESLGYRVTAFNQPLKALEYFSADPDEIDVLLTDMNMPDLTGDRLAAKCLEIKPDLAVVMCTGFGGRVNREQALSMGISAYIMKPIVRKELADALRHALDSKKK